MDCDGPLGSKKNDMDVPFTEVIMVPFPKTRTPSTDVDAPVEISVGETALGVPIVETVPLVAVTFVEIDPLDCV
ncbi:MAG: hypothetical protein AUI62_02810 [Thaumarchaeota archaeon 13_1_40CM_2_39_7]|nr:MAG: hypothetical protein AUI62_02810 [Thaumarchaeota archaeon 13_1_40CM_2_39_7]